MGDSLYRGESTQEAAKEDIPGVICPAPVLIFGSLIVGLLLDYVVSLEILRAHVGRLLRFVVAAFLILIGLWLLWVGNAAFRRIGTAVLPWKPSRVLAKTGIYSETRNPIYQGFVVLVLGLAILFRSDWTVLLLVPAVLVLHYGVILREERYLEGKFGDVYRTFTQDVPRYGLPLAASRRAEVAVGLSAAALIAGLAVLPPREASWTMEPIKIGVRDNHYNWTVPRPALAPLFAVISDNPQGLASNLRLFEDKRPLGPHTHPPDRGSFIHWNTVVLFMPSDNSDPWTNRRVYDVRATIEPVPINIAIAVALITLAAALTLIHRRRMLSAERRRHREAAAENHLDSRYSNAQAKTLAG
jgi:protein-S-isoprenylcysteine O-methyltransferase Ste14